MRAHNAERIVHWSDKRNRRFFNYFRNFTPAMVPFRQTSWQGLAHDANAMLNWRGSSIAPLRAIRAPLSEMSTTLQSRLAKPPSITRAGKSRFMRRSARFWLLNSITLGAFEYDPESSLIPMSWFRGSHRAPQIPSVEVRLTGTKNVFD